MRARVLTLPHRHAYLDAALPPEVVRLDAGRGPALGFAPDPLWSPALVRGAGADVVHVHFGFDHVGVDELRRWCAAVRASGARLVVTVHDLRNPHHPTAAEHERQLAVLLGHADAVLTLTAAAAREIRRRYGRGAEVVPHPAVLAGPAPGVRTEHGLVGLHLKSLRPSMIGLPRLVETVRTAVAEIGGRLHVGAHQPVPGVPVTVHPRLSDDGLRELLTRLHVLVLPQRFGTHSGLLEACRDVGTAVVAPSCGCYADQWPQAEIFRHDEWSGLDRTGLAAAVRRALDGPPPTPIGRGQRSATTAANHRAHRRAYGGAGTPVALVPGPATHGVVRHGTALAAAGGLPIARVPAELPVGSTVLLELTDRLLGPTVAEAAVGWERLRSDLGGRRLLVSLHDVPAADDWSPERRTLYGRVISAAFGVVVCTCDQADRARALGARRVVVAPIPVPSGGSVAPPDPRAESVTVAGFFWPGKGHAEVLAAMALLPPDVPFVVAGTSAAGHEQELRDLVAGADRPVLVTGHLPDEAFAALLAGPTLPVAPNRAVTASATIAAWWGAGRRPLVPDVPATQGIEGRWVTRYESLAGVLADVWAEPRRSWLPAGARPGAELAEIAMLRRATVLAWSG